MKNRSWIVMVLVMVLLFSGCMSESEELKMAACGSFAVPGLVCHDLKGGSFDCKVTQRDDFGRVLFLYETVNVITGNQEKAYVICQRMDSDRVYFYEDICYDSLADGTAGLDQLKLVNDWGKPLNTEAMSGRKYRISFDLFLMMDSETDYNELRKAVCTALDLQKQQVKSLVILDANPAGQELYFLSVEGGESYLVLLAEDASVFWVDTEDLSQSQIHTFKQESGWVFAD